MNTCRIYSVKCGIREWVVYPGSIKILSKQDLLVSSVGLLDNDSENFHVGGFVSAVFHVAVNFPGGSSPRRSANDAGARASNDWQKPTAKPTAQPRQGESTTARGYYASGDVISAWRPGSLSSCVYINIMNKGDARKRLGLIYPISSLTRAADKTRFRSDAQMSNDESGAAPISRVYRSTKSSEAINDDKRALSRETSPFCATSARQARSSIGRWSMMGRYDFKTAVALLFPFDMIEIEDCWIMECLGYRNVSNFFARLALIRFTAAAFKINSHERHNRHTH